MAAEEIWSWQNGKDNDDFLRAVAVSDEDGTVLLAGSADGTFTDGSSDMVAVKLDSDGTEIFRWQGSGNTSYDLARAAALGPDGSMFLAGTAGDDVVVFHLDSNGDYIWEWEWEDGEGGTFTFYLADMALAGGKSGDVYIAGYVYGETGASDFLVYRLSSAAGDEIWKWQGGTTSSDHLYGIASVDNGEAVVVGGKSAYALVVIKLGSNGSTIWEWNGGHTNGFADIDYCSAIAASDSSVVLAGHTQRDFHGQSAESTDFMAVMLDSSNGTETWRWQDGTDTVDHVNAVSFVEDGSVVLAGHTGGDWAARSAGHYDFAAVKLSAETGEELSRFQDGSEREDQFWAVAGSPNNTVVFAGHTEGSWRRSNPYYPKRADFAALKATASFSGVPPADDGSPLPPPGILVAAVVGAIAFVSVMIVRHRKKAVTPHAFCSPSSQGG